MQKVTIDGYIIRAACDFTCQVGDALLIVNGVCLGPQNTTVEEPRTAAPLLLENHKKQEPLTPRKRLYYDAAKLRERVTTLLAERNEPLPAIRIGDILEIPRSKILRGRLSTQLMYLTNTKKICKVTVKTSNMPFYTIARRG